MKSVETFDKAENPIDGNDIATESAKPNQPEQKKFWKDVVIGGISGICFGSVGDAYAVEAVQNIEAAINDDTSGEMIPEVAENVSLSSSVNDGQTFSEAFAAARAELGAGGVFEWHGQLYSTFYQEEWSSMTDEQRDEFLHEVYGAGAGNDEPAVSEDIVDNNNIEVVAVDDNNIAVVDDDVVAGVDDITETVYGPPSWIGYEDDILNEPSLDNSDSENLYECVYGPPSSF